MNVWSSGTEIEHSGPTILTSKLSFIKNCHLWNIMCNLKKKMCRMLVVLIDKSKEECEVIYIVQCCSSIFQYFVTLSSSMTFLETIEWKWLRIWIRCPWSIAFLGKLLPRSYPCLVRVKVRSDFQQSACSQEQKVYH